MVLNASLKASLNDWSVSFSILSLSDGDLTKYATIIPISKNKEKINKVKFQPNSLKLFGYGYSWGGFESLALHQEYRETGNRKFLNLAKDEHLVRLHIGLEDPIDLIADLKKALKYIK